MANPKKNAGVTWAHATRDIVLRLIATGQLPVGIFGAVVILMVYKTPNNQMGIVWQFLHDFIAARAGLGYTISVVFGAGWFFHSRFQRKNAEEEVRRLSRERTKEQQKGFKTALESSDGLQAGE